MVERNSILRQLLAESKFVEVQKEAELILNQSNGSESAELLELYFESLKAQSRPLPTELLLSLIEKLLPQKTDEAQKWLEDLSVPSNKYQQQLLLIKIRIADLKGKTEELYNLISQYQILRFENRTPGIPEYIQNLEHKYFPFDFHIQLQRLALDMMRMDLKTSEGLILQLILSCYEKSSPRGTKEKLNALYLILASSEKLYHLEIYKNFCQIMANGIADKKDYKKVVEFIIYVEDFRFQALILNFLVGEGLVEAAKDYSLSVRANKDYSYVYFDKFFPHLKTFFFQKLKPRPVASAPSEEIDLKVGKSNPTPMIDEMMAEVSEEEVLLAHLIKHQNYSTQELLDISVSFVQSEFYYAALKASELAIASTQEHYLKLKAYYLKVTCLLKTGDYRSALDVSLDALSISSTQNDVLSFMYSQAEAHLRLKEYPSARTTLRKIIAIDADYRLAKERLERLNAI
jgi:hypothetical protein